LVHAFLFDTKTCIWSKEIKIANQLIKEHGFEFLMFLKGRQKMPSLCWFLTDNGKKFLSDVKKYNSISFSRESIQLEEAPVAPSAEVNKKPISLKDFLNIFK
jgi:hypothetical protein